MDILVIILLLGAIHGIFLAVILVTLKNPRRLANKFLAIILLLFSVIIFLHIGLHLENVRTLFPAFESIANPHQVFKSLYVFDTLALLVGPLTYFYFKAIVDVNFTFNREKLVHFIPAIVCAGLFTPLALISFSGNPNVADNNAVQIFYMAIRWFVFSQFLFYIVLIVIFSYKNVWMIKDHSLGSETIQWMTILIISYILLWGIAALLTMTDAGNSAWNYVWIIASLLIYTCGYLGLKKPSVFQGAGSPDNVSIEKYKKSVLSSEMSDQYMKKLENFMRQEKPYLKNDLSLPILADQLKIPVHHLSQVINERFNQNFYEFINRHRVEHALSLIKDESYGHLKIAEIGYQSGFNSISVFNAAFKKMYHQTPAKFREIRK